MSRPSKPKVALSFRVDPDWLKKRTYVPDGVTIRSTGRHPIKFMQLGILGGSGLEMWFRDFPFIFTRKVAEQLIKDGFAEKYVVPKPKH